MKTNAECAELCLNGALNWVEDAQQTLIKIGGEISGRETSASLWKEMNPDDGVGFGSANPFLKGEEQEQERVKKARLNLENAKCYRDFVLKRICQQVQ